MAKGGALKPVYIVTDDELEINGGDFVLQQGPAMKVRGFTLDNYAGRKIQSGAAQPVYVVLEASAPSLHGDHWRVIAGQPTKVLSVTNAERNIIQGPAIPVYPVDDDGAYDPTFYGYSGKVLSTGPIAYWILGEAAGVTAVDQINSPAQDGTYNNVTLGQVGIGDGNTCPLFNGVNSYVNVFSAALQGAFAYTVGSLQVWERVLNAGVWTDGTQDTPVSIGTDGGNRVYAVKRNVNNRQDNWHRGGGSFDGAAFSPFSETGWFVTHITWDEAGPTTIIYLNGAAHGVPAGCGAWVGLLNAARCVIGDFVIPSNEPWNGYLAHVALWDRVLTPAEAFSLATV